MATSRTGTSQWLKIRNERRRIDLDAGIFQCPLCNIELDWVYSGRPNSVEVDHINAFSDGGQNAIDNTRCICRRCNQSRGGRQGRAKQLKAAKTARIKPLKTSREW